MLTCGDCQLVFTLSDIVEFVRHKQTTCLRGATNGHLSNYNTESDDDDDDEIECNNDVTNDENQTMDDVRSDRLPCVAAADEGDEKCSTERKTSMIGLYMRQRRIE